MKQFRETGGNGIINLEKSTKLVYDLKEALESDVIVISIPSQKVRELMEEIKKYSLKNKIFILCMKGIEISTKTIITSGNRICRLQQSYRRTFKFR